MRAPERGGERGGGRRGRRRPEAVRSPENRIGGGVLASSRRRRRVVVGVLTCNRDGSFWVWRSFLSLLRASSFPPLPPPVSLSLLSLSSRPPGVNCSTSKCSGRVEIFSSLFADMPLEFSLFSLRSHFFGAIWSRLPVFDFSEIGCFYESVLVSMFGEVEFDWIARARSRNGGRTICAKRATVT